MGWGLEVGVRDGQFALVRDHVETVQVPIRRPFRWREPFGLLGTGVALLPALLSDEPWVILMGCGVGLGFVAAAVLSWQFERDRASGPSVAREVQVSELRRIELGRVLTWVDGQVATVTTDERGVIIDGVRHGMARPPLALSEALARQGRGLGEGFPAMPGWAVEGGLDGTVLSHDDIRISVGRGGLRVAGQTLEWADLQLRLGLRRTQLVSGDIVVDLAVAERPAQESLYLAVQWGRHTYGSGAVPTALAHLRGLHDSGA